MFNFDGQEDDQAAYDLSPSFMVNISLDGRFRAVIVTPNPSLSLSLSLSTSIYIYKQFGSRSDPNEI